MSIFYLKGYVYLLSKRICLSPNLKGCFYLLSREYVYLLSKEYALANLSILR